MSLEKGYSRQAYEEKEGEIRDIATSVDETTPVGELRAKFAEMETHVADREALHGEAFEQATAENAARDAAKETAERAASEQAEAAKLLEQMRAKAGPSVEQPAATAQARGAQETVPAEVTIGADELNQIRMMRPHWGEYESSMPAIEADIGRRVLSDISGGRLRFNERGGIVPSKGGREISPRQAEEIIGNLERSERTYGREAIDYVTAPKRKNGRPEIGNDRGEIEVGKDETFAYALKHKIYRNNDTRGKLALGAAFTSLAPFVAGLGMAIAGTPAAGAVMLGMIPVAAISFGGLGVKYLYDKYKERKAAKDYSTASVAKGARSKLSGFLGRK